jgi:hypothetical protein
MGRGVSHCPIYYGYAILYYSVGRYSFIYYSKVLFSRGLYFLHDFSDVFICIFWIPSRSADDKRGSCALAQRSTLGVTPLVTVWSPPVPIVCVLRTNMDTRT